MADKWDGSPSVVVVESALGGSGLKLGPFAGVLVSPLTVRVIATPGECVQELLVKSGDLWSIPDVFLTRYDHLVHTHKPSDSRADSFRADVTADSRFRKFAVIRVPVYEGVCPEKPRQVQYKLSGVCECCGGSGRAVWKDPKGKFAVFWRYQDGTEEGGSFASLSEARAYVARLNSNHFTGYDIVGPDGRVY